jgi:hypothetical protein
MWPPPTSARQPPEELLKQLELATQKMKRIIVESARNLKIGLERKWIGGSRKR